MRSRAKLALGAGAALALALPALAQESILPPGFNQPAPAPTPAPTPTPAPATGNQAEPATASRPAARPRVRATVRAPAEGEVVEGDVGELVELQPPPPPIEIPPESRRDARLVGAIDPVAAGLGERPWGGANGTFLSRLMRRQSTPLPSRWLHITLRNALLARAPAPPMVNGADWAAERAWLLLRMGEADAARMVVSGVDVEDFTPKMTQVAVQSALANADPAGLCPLRPRLGSVEPKVEPLVRAMCSGLEGESSSAASQIGQIRRRGRVRGIDMVLADKVVGAGADTSRAVTVEWEPVDRLTTWRAGLSAATGLMPPERLVAASRPQVQAWLARAPLLPVEQRLGVARIATGLGVFSSDALTDFYSALYDSTDPSDLAGTDAWKLRTAYAGKDQAERLGAMRELWREGRGELEKQANHALLARAATLVRPDAELQGDAADLIASMLAGGFDQQAARWAAAVSQMDDEPGDRAWALLALGTNSAQVDVSAGRINSFIGRDDSPDKVRSRLLLAGLAGTGRIDSATASRLNSRHELGMERTSVWTRLADDAGRRGQAGSAVLLAAIGLQSPSFERVGSAQLFHALSAIRASGLDHHARMIAAEALART